MHLPYNNKLPVRCLAACFNNTSTTYKYYWLLSILQSVENGQINIPKIHLFARMLSNAWYTVNYFHVSFGKQDHIQTAIKWIHENEKIAIDEKSNIVFERLSNTRNKNTVDLLWHFDGNVPHWFLSPWFPRMKRADIYKNSQSFSQNSLYSLHKDSLTIHPEWIGYLTDNSKLLKDYCYWNLALFLQSKNPNVPDIPNKLIKPAIRNSLAHQRKYFWDIVFRELGNIKCIYTGSNLTINEYAVEHFIPYNFVSHDLIWNLIPADKSFNSTKSDKLPSLEKYFEAFFDLQKQAIDIISTKNPSSKFLEEYITIFPDINSLSYSDVSKNKEQFRNTIQPLITIASNNGFEFLQ